MKNYMRYRAVKHVCSIPHCKNIAAGLFSRSDDFSGTQLYLCDSCAKDIAYIYTKNPKLGKQIVDTK